MLLTELRFLHADIVSLAVNRRGYLTNGVRTQLFCIKAFPCPPVAVSRFKVFSAFIVNMKDTPAQDNGYAFYADNLTLRACTITIKTPTA